MSKLPTLLLRNQNHPQREPSAIPIPATTISPVLDEKKKNSAANTHRYRTARRHRHRHDQHLLPSYY